MESVSEKRIGPEKFYFNNLEAGRFMIQRCDACSRAVFFPRNMCPHCGDAALSWFEPAGNGTVYATTTVHPTKVAGDSYNVCLVDLDEGVRLMARVVDVPVEAIRIGMRVKACVDGVGAGAKVAFVSERGE